MLASILQHGNPRRVGEPFGLLRERSALPNEGSILKGQATSRSLRELRALPYRPRRLGGSGRNGFSGHWSQ